MCNGIVSLGDPGLSTPILTTQLQETKSKFVVCFQGSGQVLHQALKEIEETIQVIILPSNLDEPVIDQDYLVLADFIQEKGLKEPEVEQFEEDDTIIIFWSSGTTGLPKGIQHSVKTFQYVIGDLESRRAFNDVLGMTTTCFFSCRWFLLPFEEPHP